MRRLCTPLLLAALAGCEGASTPEAAPHAPLGGAIETEIRLDGCRLLVQADPGTVLVGDPIRLLVIAEPAPGFVATIEAWPPAGAQDGAGIEDDPFEVSPLPPPLLAGLPPASSVQLAELRAFEGGLWAIPTIHASFEPRGGGAPIRLASGPLAIEIRSVLDELESATALEGDAPLPDLRDLKAPIHLADASPWVWWVVGLGTALCGLVALSVLRRRPEPPAPPPHQVALDALDRLSADLPADPATARESWARLLAILRAYLQDGLGIAATSRTGRELAAALHAEQRLPDRQRSAIAGLLRDSDLVVFAGNRPDRAASEQAIATVRRLVEETSTGSGTP